MDLKPATIIRDVPEYTASYSEYDLGDGEVMTMFHLTVYYFSASILRQMLREWEIFRTHCPQVIFCHGEVDDDKFAKFISKFGFEFLSVVPCTDGVDRRLFVNWGLAKPHNDI